MTLAHRWPPLVCLGEALIDLFPIDTYRCLGDGQVFRAAAGGAPANVAVGVARLGVPSALIGKVGADPFGAALRELLRTEGVDVRALREQSGTRTALAFVDPEGPNGHRFFFYRHATADTLLGPADIDLALLANARIFHFGSVSLSVEPSRSTTLAAARQARDLGALVSFDPNVRLDVWRSEAEARDAITQAVSLAHVVKLSSDEIDLVCGTSDPILAAKSLVAAGPSLAVVTLGAAGCAFASRGTSASLPAPAVEELDPTGAGDAFVAGLLAGLLRTPAALDALIRPGLAVYLEPVLRFAGAAGALATTQYGAIPGLPTLAQVENLLYGPAGSSTHTAMGGLSA